MPFIDVKITTEINQDKKEQIKKDLGNAISIIPGKSENWLMVGIKDNYDLYFKGNQDEVTAFVDVKIYGGASGEAYNKLTKEICNILFEQCMVPSNRVYVSYQEIEHWGYNGGNF